MFMDSWGNEYDTLKEAKNGILNICTKFLTPNEIELYISYEELYSWVIKNFNEKFLTDFKKEIKKSALNVADWYFDEIEKI